MLNVKEWAEGHNIVTSAHPSYVERSISFPRNLRGERVLDVGGGASLMGRHLATTKGAIVISVDPGYRHIRGLIEAAKQPSYATQLKIKDQKEEYRKLLDGPRKDDDEASRLADNIYQEDSKNKQLLDNIRDFESGIGTSGLHLVAGAAEHIPLRGGTIRFAFAHESISRFLLALPDQFVPAVDEVIRTLVKDGEFQIAPWDSDIVVPEEDASRMEQIFAAEAEGRSRLLQHLSEQGIYYEIRKKSRSASFNTLQIYNAPPPTRFRMFLGKLGLRKF